MATAAAQYIKATVGKARHRIFELVIRRASFFGEVDGLPDVQGFLASTADSLRSILTDAWGEMLPASSPLPIVVNILINPNLFFCDRDALHGQYHKYFRPIYLDSEAIRIEQDQDSNDEVAHAAVRLHKHFDDHYHLHIEDRTFLSLNDIETLLANKGHTGPFPLSNRVVSIWRPNAGLNGKPPEILSDMRSYDKAIAEALKRSGADAEKFHRYLELVTKHEGSYHHITIGSRKNWIARVYLLFRDPQDPRVNKPEWLAGLKAFTFDMVIPLALAGTFIRNPGIVAMLSDVHELLLHSHETGRRHSSTFERFFGAVAQTNRKLFPTVSDVSTTKLQAVVGDERSRLHEIRRHFVECPDWCKKNQSEPLTHALHDCTNGAGQAFINDIASLLKGIKGFGDLPSDTVAYLASVLTFGLTQNTSRPPILNDEWKRRSIDHSWVMECQKDATLGQERLIPTRIRPFIRALLLMTGNHDMVESNASRLGVTIEGHAPAQKPKWSNEGGYFLVTVAYRAKGNLGEKGMKRLHYTAGATLHPNKNGLLIHFGKSFLSGFRMCITTTINGDVRGGIFDWIDDLPSENQTIIYGFRFDQ